jgi:hypothetical protein
VTDVDLKQVLDAPSVLLVDNTYAGLKDTAFSKYLLAEMVGSPIEAISSFICEGRIRGIAFKQDFWMLVTDIVKHDPEFESLAAALFDSTDCEKKRSVTIEAVDFHGAIVTLLCDLLLSGGSCECLSGRRSEVVAYSRERQERLKLLFRTKIEPYYDLPSGETLEICCGNGMATAVLRDMEYGVFSLDNDKCAVCEGLFHGALLREQTAVLDARYLSEYEFDKYHEFKRVVGFMLGAIYEFNKTDWRRILSQAAEIISEGLLLFTVQKKEEVDFIERTMQDFGIKSQVLDNRDETSIYDQWIYVGVKDAVL